MALMSVKLNVRRPLTRISVLTDPMARRLMVAVPEAAVRIVFRLSVSDEGRQLAQTFDRGIGALLLQDFGRINGYRQRRFRFGGGNVRTGHDDSLGCCFGGRGCRRLRVGAGGDEERKSDADCESRAEGS